VFAARIFSPDQENAFFQACNGWQLPIFSALATYGLRLGELTHLLIEDVDLTQDFFSIRSKPWMLWNVKTCRERHLPLLPATRDIFGRLIGKRRAGFVFVNADFASGSKRTPVFSDPSSFRNKVQSILNSLLSESPEADERAQRRAVVAFCRR